MRYRTTRISPKMAFRKSVVTSPRATMQVGRNDPCPCGSGKKYKNCCIEKGDTFLHKMAKKAKKDQEPSFLARLFKRDKK
ncbi:MAG: SEC-C metal-binding domain-containing protein [Candidatus Lernaella stagnicola]|nr:SEC-C metal-binding domain-containing protein [Candidatus Lernaella stagnicola]